MRTDAYSFAAQVSALLEDATLRQSVGEKGVEVIQKSFSWNTVAATLDQYLNQKF